MVLKALGSVWTSPEVPNGIGLKHRVGSAETLRHIMLPMVSPGFTRTTLGAWVAHPLSRRFG